MFITFKVLVGKNMWNYPRHYFNDASQLLFPFYEGVFPCIVLLCSTVILPCGRQVGVPAPRRCPQLSVKKNQVTYGATSARHATNPVKAPSVHGAQEHIWEDCLQSPSGNYFSLITGCYSVTLRVTSWYYKIEGRPPEVTYSDLTVSLLSTAKPPTSSGSVTHS